YFVGKLEDQLVTNFQQGIEGRLPLLEYNIREEMVKDRSAEDARPLEEDIKNLLYDFSTKDISEVLIINKRSVIIGTSESSNGGVVGQKSSDNMVKRTLEVGESEDKIYFDGQSEGRIWVLTSPIKQNGEVIGVIYLVAKIETVFEQMDEINSIFITGTVIAMF